MSIEEIKNKEIGPSVLYPQLEATTIQEAAKEPIKLRDLIAARMFVPLPDGKKYDYATALCFVMFNDLLSFYTQRTKPDTAACIRMAKKMTRAYLDWSILDLPTFVDMCTSSRIPTPHSGVMDYRLIMLDYPSIMDKVEGYDRMRPKSILEGFSPDCPARKPLEMKYKMTHKFGGVEYQWTDEKECQAYWDGAVDFDNPDEKKGQESAGRTVAEYAEKVLQESNDVC